MAYVQASHSRCGCKYYRGLTTSRFAALAHGTLRPPPPISNDSEAALSGNGSSGCGHGGSGCGHGGEGRASGAIAGNGGNGGNGGDGDGGDDDDDDGRGVWDIEDLIGFAARPEGPEGDLRRRRAGGGGGRVEMDDSVMTACRRIIIIIIIRIDLAAS